MTRQVLNPLCPLISISGITGDVGKSLAVALRMIDLFAKWLSSEVATLARGCLWKHQLLTARDKLSLLLGIHMSTMVGTGTQVWSELLRAVMTLKHHEWLSASLPAYPLLLCDMRVVEKVPAPASKWTRDLVHDRWGICPWLGRADKVQGDFNVCFNVNSWLLKGCESFRNNFLFTPQLTWRHGWG